MQTCYQYLYKGPGGMADPEKWLLVQKARHMPNLVSKITKNHQQYPAQGVSAVELAVALFVVLVLSAIAIPNLFATWSDIQLRGAASQVAGLMQQARMLAAKKNGTYSLRYQISNGVQRVFVDVNNNGVFDPGEPTLDLGRQVTAASSAPNGASGQPPAYVLAGDSSAGPPCDNTCVLAFSPRGLPCDYTNPPACTTPAASYFVYYFQDSGRKTWAAVSVTKAGRSKALLWSGSSWN